MILTNVPAPEWKYPVLTVNALCEILKDAVEGKYIGKSCKGVQRIGLVGSMARGEHSRVSDVDLLLDSSCFLEDLNVLGESVGSILDNEYNKRLDIIDFRFALDVAEGKKHADGIWKHRNGYARMLKEVMWIYGQ